ncbi:MAG: hypothetical protein ACI30K_06805 [Muribaculaceae bacterium]
MNTAAETDTYNVKYTTDGWSTSYTPAMTLQEDGTYTYTFTDPSKGMLLCLQKNGNDFWANPTDLSYTGGTKTFTMEGGSSGNDITFSGTFIGKYTLTYDPNSNQLTITPTFADVYLTGSMNGWNTSDASYQFDTTDGVNYTLNVASITAGTTFKVYYGGTYYGYDKSTVTSDYTVSDGNDKNIKATVDITDAVITFNTETKAITIDVAYDGSPLFAYETTANNWVFNNKMTKESDGVYYYDITIEDSYTGCFVLQSDRTSSWAEGVFYNPASEGNFVIHYDLPYTVNNLLTTNAPNPFQIAPGTYRVTLDTTDASNTNITVTDLGGTGAISEPRIAYDPGDGTWKVNQQMTVVTGSEGVYTYELTATGSTFYFGIQPNNYAGASAYNDVKFYSPQSNDDYQVSNVPLTEKVSALYLKHCFKVTTGAGKYLITVNGADRTNITVSIERIYDKVYLNGDYVNDGWGDGKGLEFATADGDTYTLTGVSISAGTGFKVYDAAYYANAYEHYYTSTATGITLPYTATLVNTNNAANMTLASNGSDLTITYVRSTKQLTIKAVGGTQTSSLDYYVWANFIQNTGASWARADLIPETADDGTIYTTQVFKATADGEMEWGMKKKTDNDTWYKNGGTTAEGVWNEYVLKTDGASNNKFSGLVKGNYYRIEAREANSNLDVRIVNVTPADPWPVATEPRLVLYAKNSANGDTWYEYDFTWNRIYGSYCAYITAKTNSLETYIKGMNVNNYISRYGVAAGSEDATLAISKYSTSGDALFFAQNCLVENGDNITLANIETGKRYRVELQMYDGGSKARLRYFLENDQPNTAFDPANNYITFHWQYKNASETGDGHSDSNNWTRRNLVYDPERDLYTLKIVVQKEKTNTYSDTYYIKHSNGSWNCEAMTQINGKFYYTISNPAGTQLAMNKNTTSESDDFWANPVDLNYNGGTKTFTMEGGESGDNIKFAADLTGDFCLTYDPADNTLTIAPGQAPGAIKALEYIRYTLERDADSSNTYKRITAVPVDVWNAGCLWTDNGGNAQADNPDFTFEPINLDVEAYEVQMRYNSEIGEADIRLVALSAEEPEPTKYYIVGEHINGWNYAEPAEMTEEVAGAVYSYYTWLWKQGVAGGKKTGFRIANTKGTEDEFNATYYGPVQADDFLTTSGVAYTYNVGNRPDNMGTWQVTNTTESGEDYYRIELNVQTGKITVTNVTPGIEATISVKASTTPFTYGEAQTFKAEMPAGASAAEPIYYTMVNEATATVSVSRATTTATEELLSFTINGMPVDELPKLNSDGNAYVGVYKYLPAPNVNGRYVFAARFKVTADGASTIKNAAANIDAVVVEGIAPTVAVNRLTAVTSQHNSEHFDAAIDFAVTVPAATLNWYPGYAVTLSNSDGSAYTCSELTDDDIPCICDAETYSWAADLPKLEGYVRYDGTSTYTQDNDWGYLAGYEAHLPVVVPCYAPSDPDQSSNHAQKYTYDISANYPFLSIDNYGGQYAGIVSMSTEDAATSYTVTLLKAHTIVTADFTGVIVTGVEDITADVADGEEIYFNLQGVRVNNPQHGCYIRVCGRTAEKVYIR